MSKNIAILGSTGSIGTQAIQVVSELKNIKVKCLSANKNVDLLLEQVKLLQPEAVCIMDRDACEKFKRMNNDRNLKIFSGIDGLEKIAAYENVELVLNSLVGNIGLRPTIKAIEAKKDIALANKETLVSAGELVMKKVKENGVKLLPVDSEHSAIFQCLQGNIHNRIHKIYLTASGGPFRQYAKEDLKKVTLADALKHPNWSMGKKISVDSATLMNKGLEVIEAKWLFHVDIEQIEVLIHPQSIVHSMVEFEDSAVMAQLGEPDMCVPIAYAFTYPQRVQNHFKKIDFLKQNNLTFENPRYDDFPALNLAMKATLIGGTMPAVLNAANERAVHYFIQEKIDFLKIPALIENAMGAYTVKQDYTLEDVIEADQWARDYIDEVV